MIGPCTRTLETHLPVRPGAHFSFLFVLESSFLVSSTAFLVEEIGLLSTRSTILIRVLPVCYFSFSETFGYCGEHSKAQEKKIIAILEHVRTFEIGSFGYRYYISPKLGVTKIYCVKHQLTAHAAWMRSTYMSSILSSVTLKIEGLDMHIMVGRYTVLVLGKKYPEIRVVDSRYARILCHIF